MVAPVGRDTFKGVGVGVTDDVEGEGDSGVRKRACADHCEFV